MTRNSKRQIASAGTQHLHAGCAMLMQPFSRWSGLARPMRALGAVTLVLTALSRFQAAALAQSVLWEYEAANTGSGNLVRIGADQSVYVAGTTGDGDIYLAKHDPNGELLWETSYDGPAGHGDAPADMLVDDLGNVYMVATIATLNGGTSRTTCSTIKWNTNGARLWASHENGQSTASYGRAIALDAVNGRLYVNATTTSPAQGQNIMTMRYTTGGGQSWKVFYDNGGNDDGRKIMVGTDGSVYATGASQYHNGSWVERPVVIKHDPATGVRLWTARNDDLAYSGVTN